MYKDPIKQREYDRSRYSKRRPYWREYRRLHPQTHKSHGESLGYKAEINSLDILKGSKRIYRPVDLEWEGKLVDVKTGIRRPYNTGHTKHSKGNTYYWKFYLKQLRKADLYLFILQDESEKVVRVLLIPDNVFKSKYIRIAESKLQNYSRYDITS